MAVTYTQEPSELVYYPTEPERVVTRSKVYNDGEYVGFVDWTEIEDATFLLFIKVEDKYRNHAWLPYFQEALDGTWDKGKKFIMPNMDPALREVLPTIMAGQPAEYFVQSGGWYNNDGVEYYNTLGE